MLSKGKIEVSREEMLKAYQRASYCLAQNKCKEKKCLYFNECVGSNLTTIKQYIEQLEQENQALKKRTK